MESVRPIRLSSRAATVFMLVIFALWMSLVSAQTVVDTEACRITCRDATGQPLQDGNYAYCHNCSQFIQCTAGGLHIQNCPLGTYFYDRILGQCTDDMNVCRNDSVVTVSTPSATETPPITSTTTPVPTTTLTTTPEPTTTTTSIPTTSSATTPESTTTSTTTSEPTTAFPTTPVPTITSTTTPESTTTLTTTPEPTTTSPTTPVPTTVSPTTPVPTTTTTTPILTTPSATTPSPTTTSSTTTSATTPEATTMSTTTTTTTTSTTTPQPETTTTSTTRAATTTTTAAPPTTTTTTTTSSPTSVYQPNSGGEAETYGFAMNFYNLYSERNMRVIARYLQGVTTEILSTTQSGSNTVTTEMLYRFNRAQIVTTECPNTAENMGATLVKCPIASGQAVVQTCDFTVRYFPQRAANRLEMQYMMCY